ncbi:hypothetical protein CK203_035533 [Vitis vinifera]|uniref:Uncharacterized protein n=1 Tax=Vitis vinifera TaxID=29760 RepID=A0A438HPQ1_VITVI|nr:hypothetical protein CK203_035533 [Vitis vinifera]
MVGGTRIKDPRFLRPWCVHGDYNDNTTFVLLGGISLNRRCSFLVVSGFWSSGPSLLLVVHSMVLLQIALLPDGFFFMYFSKGFINCWEWNSTQNTSSDFIKI